MTRARSGAVWWGLFLLTATACGSDVGGNTTTPSARVTAADAGADPDAAVTEPGVSATTEPLSPPPPTSSTTEPATPTKVPPVTTRSTAAPSPTTPADDLTVVEVVVREGRAITEGRVEVALGNRISMRLDSDARLLVHIHGFDEEFPVEAGVPTVYEFEADIPGIFEVEDHVTHRLLIELMISP